MTRKLFGVGAAVTALGLAVALTSSPALAAVDDGTWGIWKSADVEDTPVGTIDFGSTTVPSASYV